MKLDIRYFGLYVRVHIGRVQSVIFFQFVVVHVVLKKQWEKKGKVCSGVPGRHR